MNYRKRAFTALVASALALPFLASPALAGHGGPVAPGEQNIAEFCTNPFSENFVDVAATDVFALAIQCISTAGREIGQPITVGGPEGIPANQYGPNRSVLRGQMASFIARMLDAAEQRDRQQNGGTSQIQALPGYDNSNSFTDVPNNNVHVGNINRLADAGVVLGGPGGRAATIYAPNEFISRAQMASFINRAAAYAMSQNPNNSGNGTGYTAANNANYFVDSGEIAVHQANINGLASAGIVIGVQPVNEHRYAPRANVTRAQMAGFISRTLSQLFDDNRIHSLLEDLTGNFAAGDREGSAPAARTVASGSTRQFEITGLTANEEYRVTLVNCENVNRGANDLVTFTPDGNTGLANTGTVNSRITGFGFGQSGNAVSPAAQSATFTTGGTSVTVNVQNNGPECYVVVIYRNGGAGQAPATGGAQERLNIDAQGRPTEFFGISGDITVTGAQQPVQGQATVALDSNQATQGGTATGTATSTNGQPITSVRVSGDCIQGSPVTISNDADAGRAGFQFVVPIRSDAATGNCVLTVVTTFQNGTTDTDTVNLNINAQPGQATVTADSTVATQGGTATGTATSTNGQTVTSVQLSGDCVEGSPVTRGTDSDTGRTGFQFIIPIRSDAALGNCVVTVVTTFANGTTDTDTLTLSIQDRAPRVTDAFVATDTAATGTANSGDVLRLSFSERVATEGGTATQTATFRDADGDTFTVECVDAVGDPVTAGNTRATCVLSTDGRTLDITLLENPVTTRAGGGAATAQFPLTIVAINGFVDADGGTALQVDVANSSDLSVDRAAGRTVDA